PCCFASWPASRPSPLPRSARRSCPTPELFSAVSGQPARVWHSYSSLARGVAVLPPGKGCPVGPENPLAHRALPTSTSRYSDGTSENGSLVAVGPAEILASRP